MKRTRSSGASGATIYQIVVRGELSKRYLPAFEGMHLAAGDGRTAITGGGQEAKCAAATICSMLSRLFDSIPRCAACGAVADAVCRACQA